MSKQEFIIDYLKDTPEVVSITENGFVGLDGKHRYATPCICGAEFCYGWIMAFGALNGKGPHA